MAGTSTTSHPAGVRRRPRRRPPAKRRPATRRRRAVAGSRKRARRKKSWDAKRWWPALVIAAAVLVGVAWDSNTEATKVAGRCTIAGSSLTLTAEQVENAKTIASVAHSRHLPDRAIVIALATAQQESRLRNLDYGDRDSLGLFQQRPSSGWGSPAQVQDPIYAAGKFYDHLVRVPGWQTGRLTGIAQHVQRSAFGGAYQQWEGMATTLTKALAAGTVTCS